MSIVDLIQKDVILSRYSTFSIGGPAKYFAEVKTLDQLQSILEWSNQSQIPFHVIGKGSNTLFDDQGFNGLAILNKIDFFEDLQDGRFRVGAGASYPWVSSKTAKLGFTGLEFAAGIPGSVGGAIYMNAGANGQQTSQVLESVVFLTAKGKLEQFREMQFSYRYSQFQKMQGIIVEAIFSLKPSQDARAKQLECLAYRKKTQPYDEYSCGCVFQNPPQGSAGALIDKLGLKGLHVGGAEVSNLHANFIVNKGGATSNNVKELIQRIQQNTFEQAGIKLECEIRCIPFDKDWIPPSLEKED